MRVHPESTVRASRIHLLMIHGILMHTWYIDALQNIMLRKHNILLYANHVNSSDFAPTDETFGFVGLASDELKENINSLTISDDLSLPSDLAFLSKSTGLQVAPIPWNRPQEMKLFPKLLQVAQQRHSTKGTTIVNDLAFSILNHVKMAKQYFRNFQSTTAYT